MKSRRDIKGFAVWIRGENLAIRFWIETLVWVCVRFSACPHKLVADCLAEDYVATSHIMRCKLYSFWALGLLTACSGEWVGVVPGLLMAFNKSLVLLDWTVFTGAGALFLKLDLGSKGGQKSRRKWSCPNQGLAAESLSQILEEMALSLITHQLYIGVSTLIDSDSCKWDQNQAWCL